MSYEIVDHVFKRSPHKGAAFIVLAALATFARPNGVAYPAQTTLVKRSRLSLRAVRNAIHVLIEAGDVEVLQLGSGVSSTHYRFAEMYMVDDREAPAAALERHELPQGEAPAAALERHEVPGREAPAAALRGTRCRPERHEVPGREARGAALERHEVPPNQLSESVNESVNESGSAISVLKERVGRMFRREPSLRWSNAEIILLMTVATLETSQADLDALTGYYRAAIPAEKDYRRRTVAALLENWHGELDRARGWVREVARRSMSIL